jgi:hypothetical protein
MGLYVNDWLLQLDTFKKHRYCHLVFGNFLICIRLTSFTAYIKTSNEYWWNGRCEYIKHGSK